MHLPPLCRPCDFDISIELPEPSSYRVTGWRPCGHVCNFSRVGQPFNLYNYQRRSAKGVSWAYDKQLRPDTRSADSIRRFWPKHKRARTHAQLASGFKTTTLTHTRIFARGHYAFIGPRGVHCCGQQLRAAKTK